ncbi:zinc finger BED domain-containing protein 1 [Trichonephila clavipes]|nr:zinc finger BED domain-containing protein 1 [Trichonephila clavipes]
MVKVLNPRYSLPGQKHFTATAVPHLYNEVRDKIRQKLSLINKDTISATTDCWTSVANTPYITITVHFITSEWALKSACLACAHFDDDHNGKNNAEILSILNDWGIDVENIMSITTDNGPNILKSIEKLNLENAHISCFAHNINIGVNHSLDIPVLKRAIARLKKLQNAFAMSWKMKRDLHKAQELLQMKVKTLPSACLTRWWSTLKLVKRFLENQLPIFKTLLEYSNKKHLMLEGNEISSLEDFTTATELLEDITSSLSGEQYTTASAVLPLYMKIKNNLQNKDEDSLLLKSIKSEILESLNKYESHPMSSNLQLSTLCDPRFRLNFIESPEEVKKLAVEKMRNIYTTQKASNPDNFESIETRTKEQNKKGLAKFFDVFGSNSNSENTKNLLPRKLRKSSMNIYLCQEFHSSMIPLIGGRFTTNLSHL